MLQRVLETYPPSSLVFAVGIGVVLLIGGLELAAFTAVGAALLAVGHRLDYLGVPDEWRRR